MAERTLIIIKPDTIQRHIAGELISRFEKKGLKLVAAKFIQISQDSARKLYEIHKGKPFYEPLVKYISSSPVFLMVWEADGVIKITRKMMGATFGYEAEAGTIRGDFGSSIRYNLVHGSDSTESAEREIPLYFEPKEIVDYSFSDEKWIFPTID